MANRLRHEKSPYLLQHANNPVDWYAWGEEAFLKAREEDKPIFLSIGYATCHWCHVMERESFEDDEVAKLLNEKVVSVKVDREERPDIDHIYMAVCQTMTGHGGWPLSIFMTPDLKPFFAGTYFPKQGRMGLPGLMDIVGHLSTLWKSSRQEILKAGEAITAAIQPKRLSGSARPLGLESLEKAYRDLKQAYDPTWGGFSTAPKFPTPHHLTFLLRWHRRKPESQALTMAERTLDSMRAGGMFDQVGFGFHRYSVDERWLVPHFEKMLYDQAMLAMAYVEAFQATGSERHGRVAREIFEYVLRDMTSPEGGFYSAEDADSEGEEGRFYVWTPQEVRQILGEELGELFCSFYGIRDEGNFEHGTSIPHISRPLDVFARGAGLDPGELEKRLEEGRRALFEARNQRVHPLKDDKVLTSWNALMIVALARGYQALGDSAILDAAERAMSFMLSVMRDKDGSLFRRYRLGEVAHPGYLDDYAFLVWGLLELYESTFKVRYLEEAVKTAGRMMELFRDEHQGGFFYTGQGAESLIVRSKEIYDGAIPSSNSVAFLSLLRLGRMTGDTRWEAEADRLMMAFSELVEVYPSGYTQFLNAVDFGIGPSKEVVIAGDVNHEKTRAMVEKLHRGFAPNRVLMVRDKGREGDALADLCDFVKALKPIDHQPVAYVCENFSCTAPITEPAELEAGG